MGKKRNKLHITQPSNGNGLVKTFGFIIIFKQSEYIILASIKIFNRANKYMCFRSNLIVCFVSTFKVRN